MIKEQVKVEENLKRIVQIFKSTEGKIRPHFLLTGPSGSGKSYIIKRLATLFDLHYMEISAAQLTKEGTSGNSLSKALAPLAEAGGRPTLCFVDEFDKLFISGNSNSSMAHEITNGVQNEFLQLLESETTQVFGEWGKYQEIAIDNVLFVFAGAFNNEKDIDIDRLRSFGIKTEFLGRVSLIYNLEKLSVKSMYEALKVSELLKNYSLLFPEVSKKKAIKEIMTVVDRVHEKNTLGIRLLHTLLNQYYINDGKLDHNEVQKTTFQKVLSFKTDSG